MVHKFSFVIILLLAIIGGISLISGCHRGMGHCPFHRKSPEKKANWAVKRLSKKLNLNDSQKQKLNQIKDEVLVRVEKVKGSHEDMFNTILSQVQSENIDESALNQLFEEKEPEFKELRTFLIAKLAEFHSILEPGQRAKLAELMKKIHKKNHH